jgi:superfamily II DNA/RNA helicase
MLIHILDQQRLVQGDGPIGLVLAPTRELAAQIYTEAKKFARVFNVNVVAIYGGSGKWEMTKALKESPEIVVATPGRLIELIKTKATNLARVTFIVLDEADRMFEMGFEYQMKSIVNNIRPDRQTLLFSATMKKKVEGFAREILRDPIRIVVGMIGQANPDIRQECVIVPDSNAKWSWLSSRADEFVADGKVLIFVLSKAGTEELTSMLKSHFLRRQLAIGIDCLHGDKDQNDRSSVMRKFSKTDEVSILVATDIAARGLDVKDIRTVINYDVAKNIETYVHRIGRTGRMGTLGVTPGTAFTLITPQDSSFAVDLIQNLNLSSQPVVPELERLASKDPKYAKLRHGGGSARGGGARGGLGSGAKPLQAFTSSMLASESRALGQGAEIGSSSTMEFGRVMGRGRNSNSSEGSGGIGGYGFGSGPQVSQPPSVTDGNMAANPYIEGHSQGRGKHLTQPSWVGGSDASVVAPVPPKRSRFGEASSISAASATLPQPPPSGPILSGFVRSSQHAHTSSLSTTPSAVASLPQPSQSAAAQPSSATAASIQSTEARKKSRWDS